MTHQSLDPFNSAFVEDLSELPDSRFLCNSDFGLGGSVWACDVARGARFAYRTDTKMMLINYIDRTDAEPPVACFKYLGHGGGLGDIGIHQFLHKKLVDTASTAAAAVEVSYTDRSAISRADRRGDSAHD